MYTILQSLQELRYSQPINNLLSPRVVADWLILENELYGFYY